MTVGALAGILSTVGFKYIQPFLLGKLKIHDTCGVNNLHGMPGLFGGLLSVLIAGIASSDVYDKFADEDTDKRFKYLCRQHNIKYFSAWMNSFPLTSHLADKLSINSSQSWSLWPLLLLVVSSLASSCTVWVKQVSLMMKNSMMMSIILMTWRRSMPSPRKFSVSLRIKLLQMELMNHPSFYQQIEMLDKRLTFQNKISSNASKFFIINLVNCLCFLFLNKK